MVGPCLQKSGLNLFYKERPDNSTFFQLPFNACQEFGEAVGLVSQDQQSKPKRFPCPDQIDPTGYASSGLEYFFQYLVSVCSVSVYTLGECYLKNFRLSSVV